jgi:hypothetical protein
MPITACKTTSASFLHRETLLGILKVQCRLIYYEVIIKVKHV